MNAISKKLLSWLCVAAMVLSMAPAMNLSNFAVETKAASVNFGDLNVDLVSEEIREIMDKGNSIDNSDEAILEHIENGTCPMCDREDITWIKQSYGLGDGHYYWDEETTVKAQIISNKANSTQCFALLESAAITASKFRIMGTTGQTINIMGTGSITANQTELNNDPTYNKCLDLGLFQSSCTVNLYGGHFMHKSHGDTFTTAVIRAVSKNSVYNIFEGAKIGPDKVNTYEVAQNVMFTEAGTVNMYGGIIQNGVAPGWGYSGNVTISKGGTFNMYGGEITGGTYLDSQVTIAEKTNDLNIGGNVVVGGKYQATLDYALNSKGVMEQSYTVAQGTFNMYGGLVSGGKTNNGGNGGGNIVVCQSASVANLLGGKIEEGYAKSLGGNVQATSGTINIGGSVLITAGETGSSGGNVAVSSATATLNITGGSITDGSAKANGGNIYVDKVKELSIDGVAVENGEAGSSGGNMYVGGSAEGKITTLSNSSFQDGIAGASGGNICFNCSAEMSDLTVLRGQATSGGNINCASQKKTLKLVDCTVADGWVTATGGGNWGGNIRTWGSSIEIDGGLYYGGVRGPNKDNVGNNGNNIACLSQVDSSNSADMPAVTLTIKGNAVIVGDINTSCPTSATYSKDANIKTSCPGTTVVLEGTPKIVESYKLTNGTTVQAKVGALKLPLNAVGSTKMNVDKLEAGAEIALTVSTNTQILSLPSDNATNVAKCFTLENKAGYIVDVNDAKELVVAEPPVEVPETPEATLGGMNISDDAWEIKWEGQQIQEAAKKLNPATATTCPACGATGITWTEVDGVIGMKNQTADAGKAYHYYIDADSKVTKTYFWGTLHEPNQSLCILLKNGETAKEIGGFIGTRNNATDTTRGAKNCVINIMGEGVLTSDGKSVTDAQFGIISTQNYDNTVNLYGGTFIFTGNGIHPTKPTNAPECAAITVRNGGNTINMFDDVIVGPATQDLTKPCYNVRVNGASGKPGVFNMYGGTIRNGVSNYTGISGNVFISESYPCTFNMYDGTIENGAYLKDTELRTYGGNIYTGKGSTVNISGGTISGGKATSGGGSIFINDTSAKVNITGGTITGGHATYGGNIHCEGVLTIGEYAIIKDGVANGINDKGAADGSGGNIHMASGSLTTSGHILNGKAKFIGGNIDARDRLLTINGGVIANGTITEAEGGSHWGGNIRSWNGDIVMTDGLIYGGTRIAPNGNTSNTDANNIGVKGDKANTPSFTMSGGTVVGDIGTSSKGTYTVEVTDTTDSDGDGDTTDKVNETRVFVGTAIKISGSAKIVTSLEVNGETVTNTAGFGLRILSGNAIDVSELNADAKIAVSAEAEIELTQAFEGIAALKDCFEIVNSGRYIVLKDNKLVVAAASAAGGAVVNKDGSVEYFETAQDAINAYVPENNAYVSVSGTVTVPSALEDKIINLDTKGGTAVLEGGTKDTTVNLVDTVNKNDLSKSSGSITLPSGSEINVTTQVRDGEDQYIVLSDSNSTTNEVTYTAHYIKMELTTVSLRTTENGLYYKVKITCDDALAKRVGYYGVVVGLTDDIEIDNPVIEDSTNCSWSQTLAPDANHSVTVNSLNLWNILSEGYSAGENLANLQAKVYANVYVQVDTDGDVSIEGEPIIYGEETANGVSMKQVLEAMNDKQWTKIEAQLNANANLKNNMKAFIDRWTGTSQFSDDDAVWNSVTSQFQTYFKGSN